MADVTIEAAAADNLDSQSVRGGPFWTSPTVGYVIYLDGNKDLVYRKTTNRGAAWGGAIQVVAPGSCDAIMYDSYADWQTAGGAGTKIHIAYISADTEEVRYVYLDTNDDSVDGDVLIETCQGAGVFLSALLFGVYLTSITKTRGGNLAVAFKYQDSGSAPFNGFYTSSDATNWISKTSPYEALGDYCLLFPANLADNQDLWAAYWDLDAEEISLKTFDNSGNDWTTIGEASISAGMTPTNAYLQFDGQIRLSDGHLIFAAWSKYSDAASDLMVWDINGAGSIVAKANVITDEANNALASVFINQVNDNIYVTYVQGTAMGALVKSVYQKSINGGGAWDGELTMQADANEDMRWVSAGAVKTAWGGKFQPVWFDDDDNILFTNSDNGVSIEAVVAGLENKSANMAAKMMARGLI